MQSADPHTIGLGIASVLLMIMAYTYRTKLHRFKKYGYLGVLLISAVGNLFMFSPVAPLATVAAGAVYNVWIVGLVASLGAITGAVLSYNIGKAGVSLADTSAWSDTVTRNMDQYGVLIIFLSALVPTPFLDTSGIIAGVTRFSFWKFLIPSYLGKYLKYTFFAYVGRIVIKRKKEK